MDYAKKSYFDLMYSPKISLYWALQLIGWSSAAIYWSYYQVNFQQPTIGQVTSVLVPFALAIGYTHGYKLLAHRRQWVHLPLSSLIPIIILAWISLTACYVVVSTINIFSLYGRMDVSGFLGMLTGGLRYCAIWLLAFHLYHFSQYRSRHEMQQVKGYLKQLEAKYQMLNAELNPHFLFNALNSIKALTIEDPSRARKAIDLLSSILRDAIDITSKSVVPLSNEMQRVKGYLELEQIRFEERLNYHINISPDLKAAQILPLAILNLVENAVKHGIERSTTGGYIEINATSRGESLEIEISNTGTLGEKNARGVGLQNTRERLDLLYHDKAGLTISQSDQNTVSAVIILPLTYGSDLRTKQDDYEQLIDSQLL